MTVALSSRPYDKKKIAVLVVDDHSVLREGLVRIISELDEFEVVATAGNANEALSLAVAHQPDIILADIVLPGSTIFSVIDRCNDLVPRLKWVLFTAYGNRRNLELAMEWRVSSVVSKNDEPASVIEALRQTYLGRQFFSPQYRDTIEAITQKNAEKKVRLSPREREILAFIGQGQCRENIAKQLYISVRTVDRHRQNIMDKLNIHREIELACYAIREGYAHIPN
jgi:DNA-binding NarL/FixJ family response regulator